MIKKIESIAAIIGALGGAFLIAYPSYANPGGGWSGGGSDGIGGYGGPEAEPCSNNSNYGRIDCAGVSWLKFDYVSVNGEFHDDYKYVPNGYGTDDDGGLPIGAACAKAGVGFYHLGINIKATSRIDNGFVNGSKIYGNLNDNWYNGDIDLAGVSEEKFHYTYRLHGYIRPLPHRKRTPFYRPSRRSSICR